MKKILKDKFPLKFIFQKTGSNLSKIISAHVRRVIYLTRKFIVKNTDETYRKKLSALKNFRVICSCHNLQLINIQSTVRRRPYLLVSGGCGAGGGQEDCY